MTNCRICDTLESNCDSPFSDSDTCLLLSWEHVLINHIISTHLQLSMEIEKTRPSVGGFPLGCVALIAAVIKTVCNCDLSSLMERDPKYARRWSVDKYHRTITTEKPSILICWTHSICIGRTHECYVAMFLPKDVVWSLSTQNLTSSCLLLLWTT